MSRIAARVHKVLRIGPVACLQVHGFRVEKDLKVCR